MAINTPGHSPSDHGASRASAVSQEVGFQRDRLLGFYKASQLMMQPYPDGMQELDGNPRLIVITQSHIPEVRGSIFYRINDQRQQPLPHYFADAYSATRKTYHQAEHHRREYQQANGRRRQQITDIETYNRADRSTLIDVVERAEITVTHFLGHLRSVAAAAQDGGIPLLSEHAMPHYFPHRENLGRLLTQLEMQARFLSAIEVQPFIMYVQMIQVRIAALKTQCLAPGARNKQVIPAIQHAFREMEAILSICMLRASLESRRIEDLAGVHRDVPHPGIIIAQSKPVFSAGADLFDTAQHVRDQVLDLIDLPPDELKRATPPNFEAAALTYVPQGSLRT